MSDSGGSPVSGLDGPGGDTARACSIDALHELSARPGYAFSASTFLTEGLRVSGPQAARDVRAARAIASADPELPVMGQALAEGSISREHLDVAVSTVRRIPKALKTKLLPPDDQEPDRSPDDRSCRTGAQVIDDLFTEQAHRLAPTAVEILGRQIVHRLDPDRAERFDADAYQRRSYSWSRDFAGLGNYRLAADPVSDGPADRPADDRPADDRPPGRRRSSC